MYIECECKTVCIYPRSCVHETINLTWFAKTSPIWVDISAYHNGNVASQLAYMMRQTCYKGLRNKETKKEKKKDIQETKLQTGKE